MYICASFGSKISGFQHIEFGVLADLRAQNLPANPTIEKTLYIHSEKLGNTHRPTYFVMSG